MARHFILTHGRSGSNFLSNSINLHPELVNYGEVLGEWMAIHRLYRTMRRFGRSGSDFLDFVYGSRLLFAGSQVYSAWAHMRRRSPVRMKRRSRIHSLGIKEFTFNLHRIGCPEYLAERPDIAVIYLYRENLLRRYLSGLQMKRTGVAATEAAAGPPPKLTLDPDDLMRGLDNLAAQTARTRALLDGLRGNRLLELRYEDCYRSPETLAAMAARVFDFLGVVAIDGLSKQKKIMPRALPEVIENYEACAALLEGTPYRRHLDED